MNGHTPQDKSLPGVKNGNVCIDTGCLHGGYLTALTLETGEYLQASESDDYRDGKVDLTFPK